MKEWKLRLLIVFSLLSIAGLILIQAYWIRDAIKIKESHFRQTVNQAVTNVVWQLERMTLVKEEKMRQKLMREKRDRIFQLDSINLATHEAIYPSLRPGAAKGINQPQKAKKQPTEPAIPGIEDGTDSGDSKRAKNEAQEALDELVSLPLEYTDSLLVFINKSISQGEGYRYIRNYLEEVFNDVSGWQQGNIAHEILDSVLLQTLLHEELEKEGIRLRFLFGVYLPFTGKVLFSDSAEIVRLARETDFAYSLFPNFKLSKPVYLVLAFPDEQQYLFTNLSKVLSISLLLTLILIWSFYFITRNTYRQKKLGEMKNDFINNMTHEFKTPVSTISLACEALRDKDVEKSGVLIDNYLKIIDEENRRLGKLAEQILQTAIIDKGHLYLSFEEVDLHALVRQVIEKYEPLIRQREGHIGTKLFAENPMLLGDRTHIYNMISNLVDNAIKYSKEKPVIEILTTGTDQKITFSIRDQGVGISKVNQKRIFEKLYRVPTGNLHNTKGFGLGLSYVKYIVDRHEGAIHVESELHKGSRFAITLPRQPLRIHEHKRN